MKTKQLVIFGGSGFAREVAWLAQSCTQGETALYEVVAFADDNVETQGTIINEIPVMSLAAARQQFPEACMAVGVGNPGVRQRMVEKAAAAGFSFATLIHPRVEMSQWVTVGEGSVICAGNILTVNINLRKQVQINLDCTIGHDVEMGEYTTLTPGVHVSGWVHFGKRVYVGTGAVIINGTKDAPLIIGDDAVIAAGACVIHPVPAGATVAGVPAKIIKTKGVA